MTEQQQLVPPANLEAEQSVLGAILLRAAVFDQVVDLIDPQDFYRNAHGVIYRAMVDLWNKKEPIDLVTVTNLLKIRGKLDEVGGAVFLAGLSEQVGTAANAPHYAKIVKEKATLRNFLQALQEVTSGVYQPIEDVNEFLDKAENRLFQVSEQRKVEVQSLIEVLPGVKDNIEELYHLRKQGIDALSGVTTGFTDLDRATGGFQKQDLIILAARPSMGKTALATSFALKHPTAVFSLEMSKAQMVQRFMANVGRLDAMRLRTGNLEADEWTRFMGVDNLLDRPIFLIDQPGLSPLEVRAQARRLKAKEDIQLVVVDYLQLMCSPKAKSREQEVSEISRSLKALAKELNVPVIALSQLNRDVEKRDNKRPRMSDLRDSGSLEQDADVILFIYRDVVYNENLSQAEAFKAEINVAKQRMGPTKTIFLGFQAEFSKFVNYSKGDAV